jgi:hypothetical protein
MTSAARKFTLTAPVPTERDVHEAVAHMLDALLLPPAFWFTYPAGASQLSPQQAARHSRVGLKRGLPDIWILHHGVYGIELKRDGQWLSKTRTVRTRRGAPRILEGQEDTFPRLIATGAFKAISICHSIDDVLDKLKQWNIPHRRPVECPW